jgi:hypothetical protein
VQVNSIFVASLVRLTEIVNMCKMRSYLLYESIRIGKISPTQIMVIS